MKLTLDWLKSHLETSASLETISEALTNLGLEVEKTIDPAAQLQDFTIGRIIEAEPHPNADRLQLCKVDCGYGQVLSIVCGARNARVGIKVIVAHLGTLIPASGDILKEGMVRGSKSQGMLCSWAELSLENESEGIAELDEAAPVGEKLVSFMTFDPLIDINVTPNRADCLGVRGIARDLAAKGIGKLKPLKTTPPKVSYKAALTLKLPKSDEPLADSAHVIMRAMRDVTNGSSPVWMQSRLQAIGLKPISALVDITNYLTYDLGRPAHIFDADKVGTKIQFRAASSGETLQALNGKSYALNSSMLVISNEKQVLSLAGIMGGAFSGCDAQTKNILIEIAWFDQNLIAQTGRQLDLLSDARYRFERGVDPYFLKDSIEIITALILQYCGGEASQLVEAGKAPAAREPILYHTGMVKKLGGIDIPIAGQSEYLSSLGCLVNPAGANKLDQLMVTTPAWRNDIKDQQDLVEEVLRLTGYDAIPYASLPRPSMPSVVLTGAQRRIGWMRHYYAFAGLTETISYSFVSESQATLFSGELRPQMQLANPISSDLAVMRPSLLISLIATLKRNHDRGFSNLGLFECGPQFDDAEPGAQQTVLASVRSGQFAEPYWGDRTRDVDCFDAKGDAQGALEAAGINRDNLQVSVTNLPRWYHPNRAGTLMLGKQMLAVFGEIHPEILNFYDLNHPIVAAEIYIDKLPEYRDKTSKTKPALKLSPFQTLSRDFAFIVAEEVPADQVLDAAYNADKQLISEVTLFDLYQGEGIENGYKSLALHVDIKPYTKTLTDEEIEALSDKIIAHVTKVTKGRLR